ncbi:MAG: hypothetical protein KF774_21305 [Planctomyces sp.]|nr:hypothetical protein [Planctomyces sp.]
MAHVSTFPLTDLHAYNVPLSQVRLLDPTYEGCVTTMPRPPKFTPDEAVAIHDGFVVSMFYQPGLRFWTNTIGFEGDMGIDRTLPVGLEDLALLTPAFLTFLQEFLQRQWPRWRIVVVNHSPQEADYIFVYPDSIWIDGQEAVGNYRAQLDRLVRRQQARRDREEGPLNEQKALVEKRLATVDAATLRAPWCAVVGRFDGMGQEKGYETFWIAFLGRDIDYTYEMRLSERLAGEEHEFLYGSEYGLIHGRLIPYAGDEDGMFARYIHLPQDSAGECEISCKRDRKVIGWWSFGSLKELRKQLARGIAYGVPKPPK